MTLEFQDKTDFYLDCSKYMFRFIYIIHGIMSQLACILICQHWHHSLQRSFQASLISLVGSFVMACIK